MVGVRDACGVRVRVRGAYGVHVRDACGVRARDALARCVWGAVRDACELRVRDAQCGRVVRGAW